MSAPATTRPPSIVPPSSVLPKLAQPSRRAVLLGAAVLGGSLLLARRVTGYERLGDWEGGVLSEWEATVVAAVAEALVPDEPGGPLLVAPQQVAKNVDAYLRGMPKKALLEVHGLMWLLEHGTLLRGRLRRLTRLEPADRLEILEKMAHGPLRDAYRGIRDLCLLGTWQDARTWDRIGYPGPLVAHEPIERRADGLPRAPSPYDALLAPAGALPSGAV